MLTWIEEILKVLKVGCKESPGFILVIQALKVPFGLNIHGLDHCSSKNSTSGLKARQQGDYAPPHP
jgi:hypothetical protein